MKTVEYFARALALLWAGFWTCFFIAESLVWHTPVYRMTIWVCVGLMFGKRLVNPAPVAPKFVLSVVS